MNSNYFLWFLLLVSQNLMIVSRPNKIDTALHSVYSIQHPNDINSWQIYDQLQKHEDPYTLPTPLIIIQAGYDVETHQIVTPDGYILTIHRIPNYNDKVVQPVFLQHGLMSSSADWVITGPDHALAFQLADLGYDVWMGNFRGNTYSKGHINPDISEENYWKFTWDEHAEYDIPAMLSHMQNLTKQSSYFYIGHSMGTLSYFTACNYHAWVCDDTKLMVGYGPHTTVPHLKSPLFRLLSTFSHDVDWILNAIGLYEFGPSNWFLKLLADEVCDKNTLGKEVCEDALFLIAGFNKNEMNSTLVPYIVGHTPAGTSTLNMLHYSQSVSMGLWAGYDYGEADLNIARWNSVHPPEYKYDNITSPVALYWSDNDWLVVPRDVQSLAKKLPNLVLNHEMEEAAYTHLDFLWGIYNHQDLYNRTLQLMDKYK